MSRSLKIAVADDEPRMLDFYREILPLLGHEVVCAAQTGAELVAQCRVRRPDLIITDIKMPDTDGIDAARQVCQDEVIPVILVSAFSEPDLIERAGANHVMAYLIKPIKQKDLEPAITIVSRRFEEFQALRKEADNLRQAIQDRKLIERAKGILMKRTGQDEAAAFRRLQKLARDTNRKLVEVAQMILTVEEVYDGPET
ncbi:MAG: response regulator [Gemmataceae bacterium]|nr:response regulator [Gemmataceae bacterium]